LVWFLWQHTYFNWGDTDCAEETTCRGRQYLFMVKFSMVSIILDLWLVTDGFNFAALVILMILNMSQKVVTGKQLTMVVKN
jgi:hypothetical protein